VARGNRAGPSGTISRVRRAVLAGAVSGRAAALRPLVATIAEQRTYNAESQFLPTFGSCILGTNASGWIAIFDTLLAGLWIALHGLTAVTAGRQHLVASLEQQADRPTCFWEEGGADVSPHTAGVRKRHR